ncbi:unnamed protein product, partial [Protopolystoma xenopodis]
MADTSQPSCLSPTPLQPKCRRADNTRSLFPSPRDTPRHKMVDCLFSGHRNRHRGQPCLGRQSQARAGDKKMAIHGPTPTPTPTPTSSLWLQARRIASYVSQSVSRSPSPARHQNSVVDTVYIVSSIRSTAIAS